MADTGLSNLSYTNKDFNSIYPELLDLAKKISNRWDPTISNESDPGVVLLKLNAIIADKNNYNIDKNVLECFPLSVTQEDNARQLFSQLGYEMQWYKSGIGLLTMSWSGEKSETESIQIPPFFQVTDKNSEKVYTVLGNTSDYFAYLNQDNPATYAGNIILPKDGSEISVAVLQGAIQEYSISGSTLITLDMLDVNNRVYFNDVAVAQNGIFIENADLENSNVGVGNFSAWTKTSNLAAEDIDSHTYYFGVKNGQCYIEFSRNISSVIGSGLYIRYLVSDGESGNVASGQLTNFFSALSVKDTANNDISLTTDNVYLYNSFAILSGSNPETIDSAYENYKKTVGTFNTLVSLRDYINYILKSGLVSNGFVCDRTNDIQDSYSIVTNDISGINTTVTQVAKVNGDDDMQAFDLKFYFTRYLDKVSSSLDYDDTFFPIPESAQDKVISYIDDVKCIQHNIENPRPDLPYMFVNKYPIVCTIYPQYTLTEVQKNQLKENVLNSVYNAFAAKNVKFGEEVDYNKMYDTILKSDSRIKQIFLDEFTYQTYAIYFDSVTNSYKEVCVSDTDIADSTYSELYYVASAGQRVFDCPTEPTAVVVNGIVLVEDTDYSYDEDDKEVTLTPAPTTGSSIQISYSLRYMANTFRTDIVAKSILAGTTPMYDHDDRFVVSVDHYLNYITDNYTYGGTTYGGYDVVSATTELDREASGEGSEYTLEIQKNEVIQFGHPMLTTLSSYTTNVKCLWSIDDSVDDPNSFKGGNTTYIRGNGTRIYLMWLKEEDSRQYTCEVLTRGDTVSIYGNVDMSQTISGTVNGVNLTDLLSNIQASMGGSTVGLLPTSLTDSILRVTDDKYVLTTANYIEKNAVDERVFSGSNNSAYWKLNRVTDDGYYQLFPEFEATSSNPVQEYILQSDEYLIIPTRDKTQIAYTYGFGTKISRTPSSAVVGSVTMPAWKIKATDQYIDLSDYHISNINDVSYFNWGSSIQLAATNMEYINIPADHTLLVDVGDGTTVSTALYYKSHDGSTYAPGMYIDSVLQTSEDLSKYSFQYYPQSDETSITNIQKFTCAPFGQTGIIRGLSIIPLLNLITYKTEPQSVLAGQTIIFNLRNQSGENTTLPVVGNSNDTPYIQSDIAVYTVGGDNISLQTLDSNYTDYSYPVFYVYTKAVAYADTSQSSAISVDDDNQTGKSIFTIPISSSSGYLYIKNKISGSYILPLRNTYSLTHLYVKYSDDADTTPATECVDVHGASDFKDQGIYYVMVPENTLYVSITAVVGDSYNSITLSTDGIYRYSDVDGRGSVNALVKELDYNKIFNFVTSISEDTLIEDPLLPESFNNKNHVYNKYTICKIDDNGADGVKISNRAR